MSLDSPSRRPDDLVETIRDLDRRLRALESANRLTRASVGSGGLRILDGGSLTVDGATDIGGSLAVSGATTVSGGLEVRDGGDLTIRDTGNIFLESNGVLENHNLTEPERWGNTADNFSISTTMTTVVSASISVPDWAKNAFAFFGFNVTGNNGSANHDVLWFETQWTDGTSTFTSRVYQQEVDASEWVAGHISDTFGLGVTGTASMTIRGRVKARDANWGSNGSNVANVQGLVVWTGFGT